MPSKGIQLTALTAAPDAKRQPWKEQITQSATGAITG
jgi:hypothetical protein